MLAECKKEAVEAGHFISPYVKTTGIRKDNRIAVALQDLRDQAFYDALRYRFDPVLGKAHELYLNTLNSIINQLEV